MDFDKAVSVVRYTLTGAAALWGRIPELTQLLLLLMAIDIVMGLVVAVQSKDLRPDKAWRGVTKKLGALALIGVMALINPHVNQVIEIDLVTVANAFYLVPELGSIVRNAGLLDVPVPAQVQAVQDYFRTVSGNKED